MWIAYSLLKKLNSSSREFFEEANWISDLTCAQLCPTLCNPMDCSLPGFSVHGILQARILEWVAIPFSRGSSLLRDWTWVSWFAGRFFTVWTPRGAYLYVWKYWSRNKKRHTIFMNSKFNMVKKSILHNSFLITKSSHSIYNPTFYQNL